ncbi:MAG: dihydropteroate synthase [Pirellulaceae bacterium]
MPGYCDGDLQPLQQITSLPIQIGPKDCFALPEFFGQQRDLSDYGSYSIQIIAEINHAPRLSIAQICRAASALARDGADVIDIGCQPGERWQQVGDAVKAVKDLGLRVSIDSFDVREIADAVGAGAELVLSVNHTNRHAAPEWGAEVVVIPDDIHSLSGLEDSMDFLQQHHVPFRIDPILEPIGCGLAASLVRYADVRRRFPDAEMMMGIGNLTELTDCDSAGINTLLLGICQELSIHSVLTTQVIHWAKSSVRECDYARRLVHYAVQHGTVPKRLSSELIMLRDAVLHSKTSHELSELAGQLKDHNYRLFAEDAALHVLAAQTHLTDTDPFVLFDKLMQSNPKNVDASHAFYLGYELAKAKIALTLGKQYRQDEALDWGFLTEPEVRHRRRS